MNIMELGAIGQLVRATAVLVTLIYLAKLLRQSNDLARDNASKVYTDYVFDLTGRIAVDRSLAEDWVRAGSNFGEMDAVDQQRFLFYEWRAIEAWHHAFLQRKRQILGDSEWNKICWTIEYIGERQAIREAWKVFRGAYDDEFQAFFDLRLERVSTGAP